MSVVSEAHQVARSSLDADDARVVEQQLDELRDRWRDLSRRVHQRQSTLDDRVAMWRQYDVKLERLSVTIVTSFTTKLQLIL